MNLLASARMNLSLAASGLACPYAVIRGITVGSGAALAAIKDVANDSISTCDVRSLGAISGTIPAQSFSISLGWAGCSCRRKDAEETWQSASAIKRTSR